MTTLLIVLLSIACLIVGIVWLAKECVKRNWFYGFLESGYHYVIEAHFLGSGGTKIGSVLVDPTQTVSPTDWFSIALHWIDAHIFNGKEFASKLTKGLTWIGLPFFRRISKDINIRVSKRRSEIVSGGKQYKRAEDGLWEIYEPDSFIVQALLQSLDMWAKFKDVELKDGSRCNLVVVLKFKITNPLMFVTNNPGQGLMLTVAKLREILNDLLADLDYAQCQKTIESVVASTSEEIDNADKSGKHNLNLFAEEYGLKCDEVIFQDWNSSIAALRQQIAQQEAQTLLEKEKVKTTEQEALQAEKKGDGEAKALLAVGRAEAQVIKEKVLAGAAAGQEAMKWGALRNVTYYVDGKSGDAPPLVVPIKPVGSGKQPD